VDYVTILPGTDNSTWVSFLESDGNFAMGDSIRRRLLNNGYTLLIEKAV
jgi:hypothetical protein